MDRLQIDEVVRRIDNSLGEDLPFTEEALTDLDVEVLQRIFGDGGYQDYLDDQTNRQIIRAYLTNAIVLGFLSQDLIESYSPHVRTKEGRAALSLHMLMTSIEDAEKLPVDEELESLKKLEPEPGSPPHLHVIRN